MDVWRHAIAVGLMIGLAGCMWRAENPKTAARVGDSCVRLHGRSPELADGEASGACRGEGPISQEAALCVARRFGFPRGRCGYRVSFEFNPEQGGVAWSVRSLVGATGSSHTARVLAVDGCTGWASPMDGLLGTFFRLGTDRRMTLREHCRLFRSGSTP